MIVAAVGVEDCISKECLKWHLELNRFLDEYEKRLQPLLSNDALKKFRFDCQVSCFYSLTSVSVHSISGQGIEILWCSPVRSVPFHSFDRCWE